MKRRVYLQTPSEDFTSIWFTSEDQIWYRFNTYMVYLNHNLQYRHPERAPAYTLSKKGTQIRQYACYIIPEDAIQGTFHIENAVTSREEIYCISSSKQTCKPHILDKRHFDLT